MARVDRLRIIEQRSGLIGIGTCSIARDYSPGVVEGILPARVRGWDAGAGGMTGTVSETGEGQTVCCAATLVIETQSEGPGKLHRGSTIDPEWKRGAETLAAQKVSSGDAVAVQVQFDEPLILRCRDAKGGIFISEPDQGGETRNIQASCRVDEFH